MNKTSVGLLAIFFATTATSNFCGDLVRKKCLTERDDNSILQKNSEIKGIIADLNRSEKAKINNYLDLINKYPMEEKIAGLESDLITKNITAPYSITRKISEAKPYLSTATFFGLFRYLPTGEGAKGYAWAAAAGLIGFVAVKEGIDYMFSSKVRKFDSEISNIQNEIANLRKQKNNITQAKFTGDEFQNLDLFNMINNKLPQEM